MGKNTPAATRIFEDSVLTGMIDAFHECRITPRKNEVGRTHYEIVGDVDGVLQKIYRNEPVGSLDALKAIKAARQAIFNFRTTEEKGKGDVANGNRHNF
jgi:hypothetical protein